MKLTVIAPSFSANLLSSGTIREAQRTLENENIKVKFSKNCFSEEQFLTAPIKSRVDDIHAAFSDSATDLVMSAIGGNSAIELLRHIRWDILQNSNATLCGFSDITVLENALLTKTDKVSYYGPHFSSFANVHFKKYIVEQFLKCHYSNDFFELISSKERGEGVWWQQDEKYVITGVTGVRSLVGGNAEGKIIGGDIRSFRLLQGTEFMPFFEKIILFLEIDGTYSLEDLNKDLESLFYSFQKKTIQGIVFGRFPSSTRILRKDFDFLIGQKVFLKGIPVLTDLSFGHTDPILTFPIGGTARIINSNTKPQIFVKRY